MHIIHYNLTTTTKEGGVETFVWELAKEQARQGAQVTIVGGVGLLRRNVPNVAVRTVPFIDRRRFATGPLRRAYAWRKLIERLSMLPAALPLLHNADLVHIHKPYDLPLALLLFQHHIPVIYHGHGEDFFCGDRWLMQFVPALLACSSYNAATLQQHYNRASTIVYNGVDTKHFQPLTPDPELRAQLQTSSRFIVALPGRLMPWKGHQNALAALQLLRDMAIKLVIIGDGEMRSVLEQTVWAAGLSEQVVFTGTIPHRELPRYYAVADIVLGTSYASETFGMALAEAQACQRPVLASSWQGYDDVVQAGITGDRFMANKAEELAIQLRHLLNDPERCLKLAIAGRTRVEELFTWSQVATRIKHIYDQVK